MKFDQSPLTIIYPEAPLYSESVNPSELKPCCVWLDPRTLQMGVDTNHEKRRIEETLRQIRHYYLYVDLPVAGWRKLLDAIAPLALRVIQGWYSVWVGPNLVGVLTDDARQAEAEIEETIQSIIDSYDLRPIINASDWYQGNPPAITADTTDEELETILRIETAKAQEAEMEIHGLENYLRELREAARREKEEKIKL